MQDINKFLCVGERITLLHGVENHQHEFISRVEAINQDETVDVLIPISKNRIVYIKNDTVLKVIVVREGAIFEFKAKVINKLFGAIPLLRIIQVSECNKIQRRNYYRLKMLQNLTIRKLINIEERLFDDPVSATLMDISGGGLALITALDMEMNDVFEMSMNLKSMQINILGRIVRKEIKSDGNRNRFSYGISYEKINETERNIIMKFIFEEQRKLAKKGLI